MWDGLLMLLFLSTIMGAASFLAGSLPLSFSLSSRQLRVVTALGTGVLVGTCLIVIIPEGVATLYSSSGNVHHHDERALAIAPGTVWPASFDGTRERRHAIPTAYESDSPASASRTGSHDGFPATGDAVGSPSPDDGHQPGLPTQEQPPMTGGAQHTNETKGRDPHAWIGISLTLGFILMYLIDKVPQHATTQSHPQRFQISLNQFSLNRTSSISDETAEIPTADAFDSASSSSSAQLARPSSTTVGLVIHAAADGIALGASSSSSGSHLSFIIFIALMIHKAPAAFGLTSVLLKQGLSKRMARAHLIIFSLAAPVGALLTWAAIHLLGLSSDALGESASTEFATGVLLLFSGGTFLYVAMHTMQENASGEHLQLEEHGMNGYAGVPADNPYAPHAPPPSGPHGSALVDTLVTVGGMLLPLLTQWGHAH